MYRNMRQALQDLEKAGLLRRIREEVDPHLQMAEIARQAFDRGGPALLFEKVKGCRFQAAANIFGTRERMEFLFRDTLLNRVCGYDYIGETNIVDVYVRHLRSKIDEVFGVRMIQTVRGAGYVIRGDQ